MNKNNMNNVKPIIAALAGVMAILSASGCKVDAGLEHVSQGIPATLIPAPTVDINGMIDLSTVIPTEEVEAVLTEAGLPQWMIDEAMAALGDEYDMDAFAQALYDMGVDVNEISDELKLSAITELEVELETEANANLPEGTTVDFDLSALLDVEIDLTDFTASLTDLIYTTPISVLAHTSVSFQDLTGMSPDSIPVLRGVYLEKIGVRTLTSSEDPNDTDAIEDPSLMGICRDDQADISWVKNLKLTVTPETDGAIATDVLTYSNTASSGVCSFYATVDESYNFFENLDQTLLLDTTLTLTLPAQDATVGMFVVGKIDGEISIPGTIQELMDTGN